MNRNVRVGVVFATGVLAVVTGLAIQAVANDVNMWLIQAGGNSRWPGLVHAVAETARWIGFIFVGIAVHGWMTASRE